MACSHRLQDSFVLSRPSLDEFCLLSISVIFVNENENENENGEKRENNEFVNEN